MFDNQQWKILRGDTVKVRTGKDRGQVGTVLKVIRDIKIPRVVVSGINLVRPTSCRDPCSDPTFKAKTTPSIASIALPWISISIHKLRLHCDCLSALILAIAGAFWLKRILRLCLLLHTSRHTVLISNSLNISLLVQVTQLGGCGKSSLVYCIAAFCCLYLPRFLRLSRNIQL